MRSLTNFLLLVLIAYSFSSCSDHKMYEAKLDKAQLIIETDQKQALALLDSIVSPEEMNLDAHMRYIVLMGEARYRNRLPSIDADKKVFETLSYFDDKGDDKQTAKAYYYAGLVSYRTKQLKDVQAYLNRTIALSEKLNDTLSLAKSYHTLGFAFRESENSALTVDCFLKANSYYRQLGGVINYELQTLTNIGNAYEIADKLDDAAYYFTQCLQLSERHGNKYYQTYSNFNLGIVELRKKSYNNALHYFERAKPNLDDSTELYTALAELYTETNKMDSATFYLELVVKSIPTIKYNYKRAYTYDVLSKYYEKEGNIKETFHYSMLRDSVKNEIKTADLKSELGKDIQRQQLSAYYENVSYAKKMDAAINVIIFLSILSVAIFLAMMRKVNRVVAQVGQQKKEIDERVIDLIHFTPYLHFEVNPAIEKINPPLELLKWNQENSSNDFNLFISQSINRFNAKVNIYLVERVKQLLEHIPHGKTVLATLNNHELLILMYVRQRLPFRVMCILIGKPFTRKGLKICLTTIKEKLKGAEIPEETIRQIMYPITYFVMNHYYEPED